MFSISKNLHVEFDPWNVMFFYTIVNILIPSITMLLGVGGGDICIPFQ